ncbi:PEP-CTERM sorting domain-containing protein [Steroidobacter sp. S1-65]|uniref:PEP-CTERM sorting domain-containing protein n=1 Tax=Steroidobacter gossypii TaxID=2805490 RepID=A0ABS1WU33_9GAMM|nr:PEP-CTERM sorting domain-containing protein [Steroidobacter gossypii]MBM0104474.1 PEP-CTERM sorting domain-containing protein [Steroidobacter gossypii]
MKRLFALALLALGFAGSAQADFIPATWTDSLNGGSNGIYIGSGQSYTYVHDLNDNGFRPLNDVISDFHLSINLADDSRSWFDGLELAFVDLPGVSGDSLVWDFGAGGEEYGGWSIVGLLQLNVLGTLTVTISSVFGDFDLISSTLTANGLSNVPANVPEPGALSLLGLGLVGMAVSMRRRRQTRAA